MLRIIKNQRFLKVMGFLCFLFIFFGCSCPLIIVDSPPKEEAWPSWAPDSQRLAYECYLDSPISEGSRSILDIDEGEGIRQSFYKPEAADICISDFGGANQIRITTDPGADLHPVWSPNGSHIVYLRHRDGFYLVTPDGRDQRRLIPLRGGDYDGQGDRDSTNPVWSPDGNHLLFSACLDNSDRDIYIVEVDTGTITNLTPDSRAQDVVPMWTLNGQKIVFLSTNSSLGSSTSCTLERDAPHQLKVINADGSDESIVYGKEFYYDSITVSNSGQIVFFADMVSKTSTEFSNLASPAKKSWYKISLEESDPVEIPSEDTIGRPSWSPDGKSLAYISFSRFKILDIETQQVFEFPHIEPYIENFVWSPNSQYIAANVSTQKDMASSTEDHIYIFDIKAGTVHPLLQEQEKSKNVN